LGELLRNLKRAETGNRKRAETGNRKRKPGTLSGDARQTNRRRKDFLPENGAIGKIP
jgi:hypothetical protein